MMRSSIDMRCKSSRHQSLLCSRFLKRRRDPTSIHRMTTLSAHQVAEHALQDDERLLALAALLAPLGSNRSIRRQYSFSELLAHCTALSSVVRFLLHIQANRRSGRVMRWRSLLATSDMRRAKTQPSASNQSECAVPVAPPCGEMCRISASLFDRDANKTATSSIRGMKALEWRDVLHSFISFPRSLALFGASFLRHPFCLVNGINSALKTAFSPVARIKS